MIGLTTVILAGCQKQEVLTDVPVPQPLPTPEPEKDYVLADLALSLPSSYAGTRLAGSVTQDGNNWRGIKNLTLIPFTKMGEVELGDKPTYYEEGEIGKDFDNTTTSPLSSDNIRYRYYNKFYLKHGTASFLTYGKVNSSSEDNEPATNGALQVIVGNATPTSAIPVSTTVTPDNLTFRLKPIHGAATAPEKGIFIADYMTHIAQAEATVGSVSYKWATAGNPDDANDNLKKLKNLYEGFINKPINISNGDTDIMAGSAANVKAYLNKLYADLCGGDYAAFEDGTVEKAIVDNIKSRISAEQITVADVSQLTVSHDADHKVTALGVCDNYPSDMGLPDGAAVLRWVTKTDGTEGFEPQIETTLAAPISGMGRYTYPAELYYVGNSTIKTKNTEVSVSDYDGKSDWSAVVGLYTDGSAVSSNTRAVAIEKMMQYGVARLCGTVKAKTNELSDADGTPITVGDETFEVTGLIVTGQHPVGFDFKPETADDGNDHESFLYDSKLSNSEIYLYLSTSESPEFQTLLLQSKERENVNVILELKNNGADFKGENRGIVFSGTKFYLVGQVKLDNGTDTGVADGEKEDVDKRVFTQDHTTTLGMSIETLAHAYNVMPNVMTDRLQVSVTIKLNWTESTPSKVVITEEGEEDDEGE